MKTLVCTTALLLSMSPAYVSAKCQQVASDLERMAKVDQTIRALVSPQDMATEAKHEADLPPSVRRVLVIDRNHEAALLRIVQDCGWPRRSIHGEGATGAAWLITQHSSLHTQRKLLPLLEAAVQQREASGSDLAYLTDRVRLHSGLPQLYGTQLDMKGPCEFSLSPISDPASVDARRKSVGLPPLNEYMQMFRVHMANQGCPNN